MNQPSPAYERATPIEVGHVVFFVTDLAAVSAFYQRHLGFVLSDQYPERGHFLRCAADGGHHDLFLLQRAGAIQPAGDGLDEKAFLVRQFEVSRALAAAVDPAAGQDE